MSVRAQTAWVETVALVGLWLVAMVVRLPHLWSVPRLTDEPHDLLGVLALAQAGPTLTTIGSVHELLFGAAIALFGPSPYLPRLVTAIQAAVTVPMLYILTRELCRPLGRRRLEETFVMPRLAGLVAAGLLATSAAHVIITSHSARADSFTPLLVIGMVLAGERALNTSDGRWLVAAGLLGGLALQTSPVVLAILPGLLLACWWRCKPLLLSRWSVLAAVGLVGTQAAVPGAMSGTGDAWAAGSRLLGLAADVNRPSGDMYLDAVGVALVSLWRLLASQLTTRPPTEDVLSDPLAWPFVALAVVGALVLVLRGRPLLPLAALSCLVIVPYFGAPAIAVQEGTGALDPRLGGRLLMPVALAGMVAIGVAVGALAPIVTGRGSIPRLALGVALGGLVLAPLGGLRAYYAEAQTDDRAGDGLLPLLRATYDERRHDEVVLLDERLARLQLGAGGNALEALQYLLVASGIPTRPVQVSSERLASEASADPVLVVLERGSLGTAASAATLEPLLDRWIVPNGDRARGGAMLFRADLTP